jgi:hypothetical protein
VSPRARKATGAKRAPKPDDTRARPEAPGDAGAEATPGEREPMFERRGAVPNGFQATEQAATTDATSPVLDPDVTGAHPHRGDREWDLHDPLERDSGIEADRLGSGFDPTTVGDETGDASSPRPDANVADEIAAEAGVPYVDQEPLRTLDKVAERDRDRWELDPASSEDWHERRREESAEPPAEPA